MFVGERTLLIRVALNASSIRAGCEPGLLEFKTTMRIVAIAALHRSFENLMMKRLGEIRLRLAMTTHAQLRLTRLQQLDCREARFLRVRFADQSIRTGNVLPRLRRMRRVAFGTAYVVAPVFAAAKIIVLFLAGMTGETSFRDGLRRFVFEGNYLSGIAFFNVGLAWPMTRFATSYLSFPALYG
jgi:hypothetical protein